MSKAGFEGAGSSNNSSNSGGEGVGRDDNSAVSRAGQPPTPIVSPPLWPGQKVLTVHEVLRFQASVKKGNPRLQAMGAMGAASASSGGTAAGEANSSPVSSRAVTLELPQVQAHKP